MKKLLSIVLVLAMVLGLSVTALATSSYELDGTTALYFTPNGEDTAPSNTKLVDNYKAFIIDHAFEGVEDFVESNVSAIVGGTATGYVDKFNLSAYYSEGLGQYSIATTYYDGDSSAVPGNAETAICVVFYYANGFESAPTHYEAICFDTEQHLFDDQGSVEATEWKVLPAEEGKSGTTEITATKAEPELKYTIVIPTNVAEITNFGVYEVGQAKVTGVTGATDKTVISYTATTTDFKLSTDENKTMTASYYTEETAENAFPTTAVTVYEKEGDAASIPTMWVKIAEDAWNAAENGTYKATVTFDFAAEEKAEKIDWVITFNDADLGSLEYWVSKPFTAATAEGATAETQYTYTIEGESSDFDIGYGQDIVTFAVLDSCPIECTQVTITVTFLEDATHKETSKSAVFTFNITG